MKKKKKLKILKREFNSAVKRNFDLLNENANLRSANEELLETNNYMSAAGEILKLKKSYETICAVSRQDADRIMELNKENKKLKEENAKLRLENDLANMQLQDAQEKMRKPVFVPVK